MQCIESSSRKVSITHALELAIFSGSVPFDFPICIKFDLDLIHNSLAQCLEAEEREMKNINGAA